MFKESPRIISVDGTDNVIVQDNIFYQSDFAMYSYAGFDFTGGIIRNNILVDYGYDTMLLGEGEVLVENNTMLEGNIGIHVHGDDIPTKITMRDNIFGYHSSQAIEVGLPNGISSNDTGDTDTGPNDLQNYPTIDSATYLGAGHTWLQEI